MKAERKNSEGSFNRRSALSGLLNVLIIDITGKLTAICVLVFLLVALSTESEQIMRSTGLELWHLFVGTLFFGWAIWLWLMVDRNND